MAVVPLNVARNVEPDLSDWLDTLGTMAVYDKYFTRDEPARMLMMKGQKKQAALAESTVPVGGALVDRPIMPHVVALGGRCRERAAGPTIKATCCPARRCP